MAIEDAGLKEDVTNAVANNMTIRLHTGNPGAAGTANRVPVATLPARTITGDSGWDIHASRGPGRSGGRHRLRKRGGGGERCQLV